MPNAKVEVLNVGTGIVKSAQTDERVTFSAAPLSPRVIEGVSITQNTTVRVDFTLQVSQVQESIIVSAAAVALQTDRSDINNVIRTSQVTDLPIMNSQGRRSIRTPATRSVRWRPRPTGCRMDLDGDGQIDLNPARVGYMGHSLGGFYGSIFLALDPYVKAGAPYSYATHFAASTLPGVPIQNVLFQYAAGDRSVPNPTESQLARTAFMRESTQFVRYDRLRALVPSLGRNPHSFIVEVVGNPISAALALAGQTQAAVWLESEGNQLLNVNAPLRQAGVPFDVFETPELLPETLGFL